MSGRDRRVLAEVLGPLESDVMDVIWEHGEVTVRDVHRALRSRRPLAYTTVMTTMARLADKGWLRRIEEGRAHRYAPLISREEYASSTARSVVDWLMTQFRDPAVAYFLDRVEEDDAVIDALRDAIEARKKRG